MPLILEPNAPDPDAFYADLVAAHEGLTEEESQAFNVRLLFVLANQIGDGEILSAAINAARMSAPVPEPQS